MKIATKAMSRGVCRMRDAFSMPPRREQMGLGVVLGCRNGQKIGL